MDFHDKVVLIIQARMGSSRLPGKSMFDLAGAPLVGRILERVKRAKLVDEIVLAIPDTEEDKVLQDIGIAYGVSVFLGSEHDVLDRYYKAAFAHKAHFICRLPADNATPEPSEMDRIISHHLENNREGFSSNLSVINNSGYPDGIGLEVFSFKQLEFAWKNNHNLNQREHVHLNFYDYSKNLPVDGERCPVSTVMCPSGFRRPDLVLDVNTQSQYVFMKSLYEYLYPKNENFNIVDIINWYDEVYCK